MIDLPAVRLISSFVLCATLLSVTGADAAEKAPRPRPGNPTVVLDTPGGERTFPAVDLSFVSYERVYRRRGAPRSEEPTGERTDVEDRRRECHCVRLADWSKHKFSKLRQIEIIYPPDDRVARLRLTFLDGRLKEVGADALFGAADSFPPRFALRVDGAIREFLLILPKDGTWPAERLARLLLKRPPPSHRRH